MPRTCTKQCTSVTCSLQRLLWPWWCVQVHTHAVLEAHVLLSATRAAYRYMPCLWVHILFSRTRTVHTILDTLTLCTCCTRCTRFKYIYTFTHKFHNRKSTCSGTVIVVFVTSVVVRWHRGHVYRRGAIASQTERSKPIYLEHALGSVYEYGPSSTWHKFPKSMIIWEHCKTCAWCAATFQMYTVRHLTACDRTSLHFQQSLDIVVNGKAVKCMLTDVLHVPNLGYNLISVSAMDEKGTNTSFINGQCKITKDDRLLAQGFRNKGLYFLSLAHMNHTTNTAAVASAGTLQLWHARLGHVNAEGIKRMSTMGIVKGTKLTTTKLPQVCGPCVKGKIHRSPIPKLSDSRAAGLLDLVHVERLAACQFIVSQICYSHLLYIHNTTPTLPTKNRETS